MVEIASISPSIIELRGVRFEEGEKVQKIMDICHKFKHLYLEGYPCGRKTRKEKDLKLKRWGKCPRICFTYLVTNDNKSHNLAIHVLVSDVQSLLKKYSQDQIDYFTQMYTQDVADEIVNILNNEIPILFG